MAVLAHVGKLIGASDGLAIIAREPAANSIDDTVPPAALELGDDLDDVALVEAETGPVVGLVVVESTDVHAAGRRSSHDAVHGFWRARVGEELERGGERRSWGARESAQERVGEGASTKAQTRWRWPGWARWRSSHGLRSRPRRICASREQVGSSRVESGSDQIRSG